jgi:hypothetical protein
MQFDADLFREMAVITRTYIDKRDNILLAELEAIKKRVNDLERTTMVFQGPFNFNASYKRNSLVTYRRRLYISCRNTTSDEPGVSSNWMPLGDVSG